jgi:diamine N-acetyltransferase
MTAGLSITLRPVDSRNWGEVIRLRVTRDQESYVSGNMYSLLQAVYEPWWQPFAVYAGENLVGLALWGRKPEDGRLWLTRLMIDARYQGRGYGSAALSKLIGRAHAQGAAALYLSYVPGNAVAEKLYSRLGFLPTGEVLHGEPAELEHEPDEIILCLRLAPGAS